MRPPPTSGPGLKYVPCSKPATGGVVVLDAVVLEHEPVAGAQHAVLAVVVEE
jgi:hypothetical protein